MKPASAMQSRKSEFTELRYTKADAAWLYAVNETFLSFQGEGSWTGMPAAFIRLQGCAVGCPWCDTKESWDEAGGIRESVADLVGWAEQRYHVVITGGEPCAVDLNPLIRGLYHNAARRVQIETSGTYEIDVPDGVWVTVSPKLDMPGGREVLSQALGRADEIKFTVGKPRDVENLLSRVMPFVIRDIPVYLQPLSLSKRATQVCLDAAAAQPGWRISLQTHKYAGYR